MEQRRRGAYEDLISKNKKNSARKGVNIFFKILAFIFLIMTSIFFIYVVKLNMLPNPYLLAIGIALGVITILCICGLVKRYKSNFLRVFVSIFVVILCTLYIFGINYMNATMSFVDTMTSTTDNEETEEYYVVVNKDGKYSEITDLAEKNIHMFPAGENYTDIKENVLGKSKVYFKEDDSLLQMAQDLLDGKSYAILVSKSQYDMVSEDNVDFSGNTKIIYTIKHSIKSGDKVENSTNGNYSISKGIFNIYISGIDTSGAISNVARSDANIVVTVNTNTHEILLTSIPRDYYVTLHSKHSKDKLTHSGVYGIKETVTTVEDLLDIDINYYVRVNFSTLIKIIDTLGGVDVYSEYAFSSYNYSFKKGINHLNGSKALEFSRERHAFASGDRQRIKNQQAVIEAIMSKVLSSKTLLTKYTSLLKSLSSSFQTNISNDEISSLVKGQISNMNGWTINNTSLDGTGASMGTYTYGSQNLYVMIPNITTVTNAKTMINDVLKGK